MPIVGALAWFSIASTIFLGNLNVARESPEFPSVIVAITTGSVAKTHNRAQAEGRVAPSPGRRRAP